MGRKLLFLTFVTCFFVGVDAFMLNVSKIRHLTNSSLDSRKSAFAEIGDLAEKDWVFVDLESEVSFRVPPELKRIDTEKHERIYGTFQSETSQLIVNLSLKTETHCESTALAGQGIFGLHDRRGFESVRDNSAIDYCDPKQRHDLHEFLICIPDTGNGFNGLILIGKFLTESEHEKLLRVLTTIRIKGDKVSSIDF